MKIYATFLTIAIAAALAGCDTNNPTSMTRTTGAAVSVPGNAGQTSAGVTAMDQGTDPADLNATRDIRQSVMVDDQLSLAAKDVTIVASHGTITLRGTVQNADEKRIIEAKVHEYADNYVVDDQLQIASDKQLTP